MHQAGGIGMVTSATPSIVWFSDVGKEDLEMVGGKGANLGELTKAEIPVPPGFVITADTYFRFLHHNELEPAISKELEGLDVNNSRDLNARAQRIRDHITSASMPAQIALDIRNAYEELGEGAVAVRSSATAEDLPEASFAGQQSTYLNVVGPENVVEAVQACWASLFEGRAVFYREDGGWDHLTVGLAVPVQRMVQSEKSGVMFTVEPVSSDATKITIEAVYGLGEAIVSGEVSPDLYILDKENLEILESTVTPQPKMMVRTEGGDGSYQGANAWVDTLPADRDGAKLSPDQIYELASIGKRVEEYYGAPQDIEWAWEAGTFYLTQSRPVTTMKARDDDLDDSVPEPAPVLLSGQPASPGVGIGTIRIVLDPSDIDVVKEGDILVSDMTTPDFVPAMKRAAAIVTNRGGRTCHAAIVSRELGIPCVVGAQTATDVLVQQALVTVDGTNGTVYEGRAETRLEYERRRQERFANFEKVETRTNVYVNLAEPDLRRACRCTTR